MLKKIFLSALLTLIFSLPGDVLPEPPHAPKRLPKVCRTGKTALVLNGKNARIVVAPKAYRSTRFAAKELAELLGKVLGAKIPVASAPAAGKVNIYLGFNEWSSKAGIDPAKHHIESYTLKIGKNGIFIAGHDAKKSYPEHSLKSGIWPNLYERATLFGVYEFLERFANCRFYFPGELGTILPKASSLALPETEIFDYPDFISRRYSFYQGSFPGKPASDPARIEKNIASMRYRVATTYVPCCHGLSRLGYIRRFGKSNPEYFALLSNGQRHNNPALPHPGALCYSSGIREEIFQDVKSFLLNEPASKRGVRTSYGTVSWDPSGFQKGFADIMPQDSYYRCECEKCRSVFGEGPNYATEFMWNFTAEIASRLKKENIPGYVCMMAYRPYRGIPKVKLPDNVLVMVAERGPWGFYNPEGQKRDLAEIIAWTKKLNFKVWLWNYLCKFGRTAFTGVPSPTPRASVHYLKQVTPYITGTYFESETDRFINNYLVYYLHGKYSWNNKVDTDALIAEHHKLMFGKAAQEMGALFTIFEKIWLKEIVGRQVDTDLGPTVIPPSDYDLWHRIYTADRIKSVRAAFDRAEKLVKDDRNSLARVKLFRREWLDALTTARAEYIERTDAAGKFSCSLTSPAWLRPFQWDTPITKPPVEGKVSIAETAEEFVFTYECEEPRPNDQVAVLRPRDSGDIWRDSGVELFLNPSGDRKNFYQLILNIKGCLFDQKLVLQGTKASGDAKWNSNARCSVTSTAKGYKAVIRVPKSALGKYDKKGFPVNFARNRILAADSKGHAMLYSWSPFLKGFHDLENYGILKLIPEKKGIDLVDNGTFSAPARGRHFGRWFMMPGMKSGQSWELDKNEFFSAPPSIRFTTLPESKERDFYVGQLFKNMKPATTYRLSLYLRYVDVKPSRKGGGITFNFFDGKNTWFPTNNLTGTAKQWSCQSFLFTSPKDLFKKDRRGKVVVPYLRLRLLNATGSVWFDDVTLEEVKK